MMALTSKVLDIEGVGLQGFKNIDSDQIYCSIFILDFFFFLSHLCNCILMHPRVQNEKTNKQTNKNIY